MKNVLIISVYFPPCSLPPVHRARFLVNHLEEFGWHPIVLTVRPEYLEGKLDWELMNLIPNDIEVVRTRAFAAKWTRRLGIGSLGIRAFLHLLFGARRICRERPISVIFMLPPAYTWLIGPLIKKQFGVPFVVDYQDPWVSSIGKVGTPLKKAWWAQRVARFLEPKVLHSVDHIVGVSQGTYDLIRIRYPYLRDEHFTEVPLGGEPKDREYLDLHACTNPYFVRADDVINFVYVGVVCATMHRTLRALLSAVKKIKETRPELYRKMRLRFFGTTYDYRVGPRDGMVRQMAREIGVEEIVTEHPERIPYLDAQRVLRASDVILILGTSELHYTPSKIYPCILAKRPILSLFHNGSSLVQVMRETGAGRVITYSDSHPIEGCVGQIVDEIEKLVQEKRHRAPPVNWCKFEKYTARSTARTLAEVFDKVAACCVPGK